MTPKLHNHQFHQNCTHKQTPLPHLYIQSFNMAENSRITENVEDWIKHMDFPQIPDTFSNLSSPLRVSSHVIQAETINKLLEHSLIVQSSAPDFSWGDPGGLCLHDGQILYRDIRPLAVLLFLARCQCKGILWNYDEEYQRPWQVSYIPGN